MKQSTCIFYVAGAGLLLINLQSKTISLMLIIQPFCTWNQHICYVGSTLINISKFIGIATIYKEGGVSQIK